jgi:hypothetical protein
MPETLETQLAISVLAGELKGIREELKALREAYTNASMHLVNDIVLAQMKAQMAGGIIQAAGIITKPGH